MNTKKLISLLLCLIMVIGYGPVIATAAEEPNTTSTFDEIIDFENLELNSEVDTTELTASLKRQDLFKVLLTKTSNTQTAASVGNLLVAKPTKNDSAAMYSRYGYGLAIEDKELTFSKTNFAFEFDMYMQEMGSHYTMFGWYTTSSTSPIARLFAIDPAGGGSETVGDVTTTYPGCYPQTTSPSMISSISYSSKIRIELNRWYRYSFYFNVEDGIMMAYRDSELMYTATLTVPEDITYSKFIMHSGGGNAKFYFDNIRFRSLEGVTSIDSMMDFETAPASSKATVLQANKRAGNSLDDLVTIPFITSINNGYTSITKETLDDSSTNTYLTAINNGVSFTDTNKNANFFIEDPFMRLADTSWSLSFDWRTAKNITKSSSFVSFKKTPLSNNDKGTAIIGFAANNKLMVGGGTIEKTIEINKWYRFELRYIKPSQKFELYIDGVKFGDLNYSMANATATMLKFGYSWDGGPAYNYDLDNFYLHTIESDITEAVMPDGINNAELPANKVFVDTDFSNFTSGAVTNDSWKDVSAMLTSQASGAVVEANGNKYFQSANGIGETAINISSSVASPLDEGVVAIETDFTFGNNSSNSGDLVIASIKRVSADESVINAPLITTDKNGTITVASQATSYTLPAETVRMRVEFSYAFHTVNLYVNGKAIATGIPLMVDLSATVSPDALKFTDAMGNEYSIPYTGYAYEYLTTEDGTRILGADGDYICKIKHYENHMYPQSVGYIKDSVNMFFGNIKSDSWSFAIDNLKIYMDDKADLLNVGFDSWNATTATTSPGTVENIYNRAEGDVNIVDYNGNTVASTAPNKYEGSLHFNEKIGYLLDKTYVFEFDMTFNEDLENIALNNTSILAYTKNQWRNILRLNNKGEVISDDTNTVYTTMTKAKWTKVQVLVTPGSSGIKVGHVYIDGVKVLTTGNLYGEMQFRIGNEGSFNYDMKWDNVRIYLADKPDAVEPDIKGTLDGNKLIQLTISDTESLNKLMTNSTEGVTWSFNDFDTTAPDANDGTVNVLLNKGDFVRVNHLNLKDSANYNVTVKNAALEGHKQYVIESEIRYYTSADVDLEVAKIFDAQTSTYDKLLYISGASKEICFNKDGHAYPLKDASGNPLYVEAATEDATEFTRLALIVDEAAGTYSIYVNGAVAYYDCDGTLVTATEIVIDKIPVASTGIPESLLSTILINNLEAQSSATALLDIKSINVYALRNGIAPFAMSSQSKIEGDKYSVRFIAPIDMLYGKEVGFDVTTTLENAKEITRTSNLVYSSVNAYDEELKAERSFLAEEFNGSYLATISVNGIAIVDKVEITVKPFIIIGDSKIYNESFTVTYLDGKIVTE